GHPFGCFFRAVSLGSTLSVSSRRRRRQGRRYRHNTPPSFHRWRDQTPRSKGRRASAFLTAMERSNLCEGTQGMKRVVGDPAAPCEIPQGVDGVCRITAANRFVQRAKKGCAMRLEVLDDGFLASGGCVWLGPGLGRRQQAGQMIGKIERHATIALTKRLDSNPDDLSGRGDGVQIGWVVPFNSRGQDLRLED